MVVVLDGIYNFLTFVNNNWTMIFAIIVTALAIVKKAKEYFSKSKEEQIEIAKAQIKEIMLRLVTEAECDYYKWLQAGEIKRAQVIDEVFTMYPILSRVTNQAEIIAWIDDSIDDALKTMRKIFEENKSAENAE
jgi:hypothetical protein